MGLLQMKFCQEKKYGLNELPEKKATSFLIIFLRQFKSPLIYLLLVAAGIAFGVGHNVDALVILGVLFTNAMEALRRMSHTIVRVLRNQQEELIDSRKLVPGDILLLNEGDAVGADARLINVSSLQKLEASLTGESMPFWKIASQLTKETALADRTNMIYAGTHIIKGNGKALL